jgi:membrane protease YdiL (CAAX protease family)
MTTASARPAPHGPCSEAVRGVRSWLAFLAGFALLWGVLAGTAALDPTARWGVAVLAVVMVAGVAVERLLPGSSRTRPLRRLGFGRPRARGLGLAVLIALGVVLVYPLAQAILGVPFALRPGWPMLLVGVFALHGLAEELVWRGYAFRRLRVGRSFPRAVALTMPLMVATHVPVLVASGPAIGLSALTVAAVTSVPLAYLFETGRGTLWAPAIVHTAIDTFKLVVIPAAATTAFSLLLAGVALVVPLLALAVPRRALEG